MFRLRIGCRKQRTYNPISFIKRYLQRKKEERQLIENVFRAALKMDLSSIRSDKTERLLDKVITFACDNGNCIVINLMM